MNQSPHAGVWVAVALAIATLSVWAAEPTDFAGSDICIRCHFQYARQWAGLAHSQAMLQPGPPPALTGCEACHGPGAAHAAGRRKEIVSWARLSTDEQAATCLRCHQQKVPASLWQDSAHAAMMSCDPCHEVHRPVDRPAMLKMAEGAECSPCHDGLADEIAAGRHHPLADGALPCAACHQFHGSEHKPLLQMPQEEGCQLCHGDDVPKTPAHDRPDFKLKHGAEAKADEGQCLMCHSRERSCDSCHVVGLPHPEGYALEHGPEAKRHQAACLNCHEEKAFCGLCHTSLPVAGGEAE